MRKYDINELDAKIEKIVSNTVKYYYTDWKNYDRPKYMKLKGDNRVKNITLIVRTCGTFIFETGDDKYNAFMEYYTTQDKSKMYSINMETGSVKLIHNGYKK